MAATRAEHPEDPAIRIDLAEAGRHDVLGDIAAVILGDMHVEHRLIYTLVPIHAGSRLRDRRELAAVA